MREFDVVIWGATGFTGRLVAEYILNKYGVDSDLKWAIAGRNPNKLVEIIQYLGGSPVSTIVADSEDRKSLDEMCRRTKVICTTVGPYALYGDELVAACIANKTDYCDLTGEVQWMRRMIDRHHEGAKLAGVRIVHTCGFDSIPSDMGVYFIQRELKKKYGEYAQQIKFRLKAAKGGMSGGTYASLGNVMVEAEKDKSIYKTLFDPYGLNPDDGVKGTDRPDLKKVVFDKDAKSWLAPFIMAVINTKVVRRSHALAGYPYGEDFNYDEAMMTGDGIGGRLKALAALTATGVMMGATPGSILKKITDRVLPDPGEGPSKEQRENGFYNIQFYCNMRNGDKYLAKVKGDRDPGYGSTSKMLAESAICLAKDGANTPKIAGILTPSTALGDPLLERLIKNAGLSFELV